MSTIEKEIYIDEDKLYEYIVDMLYSSKDGIQKLKKLRFHHNIDYKDARSVFKYGILSVEDYCLIVEGRKLEPETKICLSDPEGHANGYDGIAVADPLMIDQDRNKFVYNSSLPHKIDLSLCESVIARRNTINYSNEFLVTRPIEPSKIVAVDIRLIKNTYCDIMHNESAAEKRERILTYYNYLREVAVAMNNYQIDAPLREMSREELTLDLEKIGNLPILKLRKK